MLKFILIALVATLSYSNQVTIATGGVTGNYFKMGKSLNSKFFQNSGNVINTEGSFANMLMVAKGETDIAFVQSDTLPLLDLFDKADVQYSNKVDIAGKVYTEVLHVLVHKKSKITSLKDLNKKRVSFGGSQSGNSVTASYLQENFHLKFKEVIDLPVKRSLELIEQKRIDALFYVTKAPSTFIKSFKNIKAIALTNKLPQNSPLKSVTLKAKDYEFLYKDIKTYGVDTYVITQKGSKHLGKVKSYIDTFSTGDSKLSQSSKKVLHERLISFDEEALITFKKLYGNPSLVRLNYLLEETEKLKDKSTLDKLKAVNSLINRLKFITDDKLWKTKEYWASPLETIGSGGSDMEEKALLKKVFLVKLGLDPKKLFIIKKDKFFKFGRQRYKENYSLLYDNGDSIKVLDFHSKKNDVYNYKKQFSYENVTTTKSDLWKDVFKNEFTSQSIDSIFSKLN